MSYQRDEKIESLASEGLCLAVAEQQTFTGHQHEAAEAESRLLVWLHAAVQAICRRNPGDLQGRPGV
jgi:hypothetical protein